MKIEVEKNGNKGRYFLKEGDKLMGEITYTMAGPELMIIDHTHVEEDYRGQGIGDIILRGLIDEVRKAKLRVLPLCPFANAAISKDPSLQDVLSGPKS